MNNSVVAGCIRIIPCRCYTTKSSRRKGYSVNVNTLPNYSPTSGIIQNKSSGVIFHYLVLDFQLYIFFNNFDNVFIQFPIPNKN